MKIRPCGNCPWRWEALDPDGKRRSVASKGQARDWLLLRRSSAWLREGVRICAPEPGGEG
jgi:hypothetical protein